MKHCVYSCYDHAGVLLYVGSTFYVYGRIKTHQSASEWFSDVTSIKIERFQSKRAALDFERSFIVSGDPKNNIQYRARKKTRCQRHMEIIEAFGGPIKLSVALKHRNCTTVKNWVKTGRIPKWRHHEVLMAARKCRLGLKETDFNGVGA